ncbi:SAG1386/EF1546 family surface-associated protein [Lacticaseibacillus salsurivasis]|uniref:SAG1386/EF1546 family surface-associated protein n=1 Tax=Lacticaseibacillus salsurivasis TaxID=3081441 RepID=UPI0030C69EF8
MNKKTDQKSPQADDANQPWNKQFEDDRDDEGNLSRVATRRKSHGTKVLQYVLWVLIALFVIVPVTYNAIASNANNNGGSDKIAVESKKSSSSKKSSKKQSSSKSSKSSKASSSSSGEATSSESSSSAASSSSVASSSSSVASSSSSAPEYYTVKSGDNAYRIALNHGITLSQFYAWNGQALHPGQSVRVK